MLLRARRLPEVAARVDILARLASERIGGIYDRSACRSRRAAGFVLAGALRARLLDRHRDGAGRLRARSCRSPSSATRSCGWRSPCGAASRPSWCWRWRGGGLAPVHRRPRHARRGAGAALLGDHAVDRRCMRASRRRGAAPIVASGACDRRRPCSAADARAGLAELRSSPAADGAAASRLARTAACRRPCARSRAMTELRPLAPGRLLVGGCPEGFDARYLAEAVARAGGPVVHVARDDARLAAMRASLALLRARAAGAALPGLGLPALRPHLAEPRDRRGADGDAGGARRAASTGRRRC